MNAVDVTIDGTTYFNLSGLEVIGDAMPLRPGSMVGGAGALSVEVPDVDVRKLSGRPVKVKDPYSGETSGIIKLGTGNAVNATVNGLSALSILNVRRTAEPYTGTLRGALSYYLSLCGSIGNTSYAQELNTRTVSYTGWRGNVLDKIKDLCAAERIDISLQGDRFFIRPATFSTGTHWRGVKNYTFADFTWSADESNLAQAIEFATFDSEAVARQLLYPLGGWTPEVEVFQVGAGEIAEFEISLEAEPFSDAPYAPHYGASAVSVEQPLCVETVLRNHDSTSRYTVAGKDGLPITPAQWAASGGKLEVEIDGGGSTLRIRITGSNIEEYGPYSISMPSGEGEGYSSLRIVGQGARYRRHVRNWGTGLDEDQAPQELATISDNIFITSKNWYEAGARLLSHHSSTTYTSTVTVDEMVTVQGSGTWWSGNPAPVPITSNVGGETLGIFGNLEGAMFVEDNLAWRVASVSYSLDSRTLNSEENTEIRHLAMAHDAASVTTIGEMSTFYSGLTTMGEIAGEALRGYTW